MSNDQTLEETVLRKLKEKQELFLLMLSNFVRKETTNETLAWSVTVCYTALIAYQACEAHIDTVDSVKWVY